MKFVFSLRNGERYLDKSLLDSLNRWGSNNLASILFYEVEIGGPNGRFITPQEVDWLVNQGVVATNPATVSEPPATVAALSSANTVIQKLNSLIKAIGTELDEQLWVEWQKLMSEAEVCRDILDQQVSQLVLALPSADNQEAET